MALDTWLCDTTRRATSTRECRSIAPIASKQLACSYLRQHIRDKCTFVEVKAYENLEAYQADEAIPEKKFVRVQEIPEGTAEPQMSLFALLDLKKKRRGN